MVSGGSPASPSQYGVVDSCQASQPASHHDHVRRPVDAEGRLLAVLSSRIRHDTQDAVAVGATGKQICRYGKLRGMTDELQTVLAAWYLAEPQPHGAPRGIPQPAGGGDRNAIPLYDFPNQKIVHHFIPEMPIRVSALRTLGAYANVFAVECFMDEMAALAKADPIAFRLAHLKDPRAKAVIEKVAAMAG